MTRRYVQQARADAAERTRHEILAAARDAVLAEGRLEFNVGEIAAAAGVARSTVYAAFGSRSGLLAAVADHALHRAGLDAVIADHLLPDALTALERSVLASCRMYAADRRLFARLLSLAGVDPEAAAPLARSLADRGMGLASLADRLANQGRLAPGVSVERATDVLWMLTGFWTFDDLFTGRGLDADACAAILVGIAQTTLLVSDGQPGVG
jgi:AcrR family transcriptional regulator